MSIEELIKRLQRYKDKTREVCLLDHRCIEAFPREIDDVRPATKAEAEQAFYGDCIVID